MAQPETAALRLARRSISRGAAAVSVAIGLMVIAIVASFESLSLGTLGGGGLTSLARNPAFRAIYGQPFDLSTAGGFAVWRAGQFVLAIAALWAMMASTRLLRGEEESGRWDLLLTGPISRMELVAVDVAVVAGACVVAGLVTTGAFLVTGQAVGGSLLFGAGVALATLTYASVGALTSQLFAQRRRAAGYGGLLLGAAFLLRMMIDGSSAPHWLRWLTPFGWVEELRPFAGNNLAPVVPLVMAPALIGAVAFRLALRRDVGEGIFRDRDTAAPKMFTLKSPLRFAFRQRTTGMLGWGGGLAAMGLVAGVITGAFTDFLRTEPSFQQAVAKAGFGELASVGGFVATMATFSAVVIGLYTVSSVHLLWEDEDAGRLDLVYATRLRRLDWLGSQIGSTAAVTLALTALAAVATWVGVVLGSATLSLGDSLIAVLNMLPIVALALGVAVLVHGVHPSLVVPVAGGGVIVAYLVGFLGPAFNLPEWVLDLSPFHHLSLAPVEPVAWVPSLVMLGLALVAGAAGARAYAVPDLQ